MKIYIILFMFIIFKLFGAEGFGEPYNDISFGPSFGYINDGYTLNAEISHSISLITSSVLLRDLVVNENHNFVIQSEVTLWFIANMGGGIGYLVNENIPFYNIFIGIPITVVFHDFLEKIEPFYMFYIEPYVRFNYFDGKRINEYGLLFKITTYDFSKKKRYTAIDDWDNYGYY